MQNNNKIRKATIQTNQFVNKKSNQVRLETTVVTVDKSRNMSKTSHVELSYSQTNHMKKMAHTY